MGANAQTSVPLFVANSVLTAAQQNISAATGVPVFATTVTRDAAFGGSNKVLAEGQLCYIEASDIVQYYTGSAWATVGPSSGGSTLISTTSLASGTTSVNNCFSATYLSYMVVLSDANASAQAGLTFRFRVGGVDSVTGYYAVALESTYSAGAYSSRTANNGTAVVMPMAQIQNTQKSGGTIFIQQPFSASTTSYQFLGADNETTRGVQNGSGFHNVATSYDGFSLILSTGTFSNGTVRVYGLANT
jgi:hypothetical protein